MSLGTQEHRRGTSTRRPSADDSPVATWASLIKLGVQDVTGGPDELVEKVITDVITSLVSGRGTPDRPAADVVPLLRELGERHACRGLEARTLDRGFRRALDAAQRGLEVVADVSTIGGASLRRDLGSYVESLHRVAATASERARRLLSLDDRRRAALGALLLDPFAPPPTPHLLRQSGLEPEVDYALLATTTDDVPDGIFGSATAIATSNAGEALIPATQLDEVLAHTAPRQVVIGPPARLLAIVETAEPVRRATHLLQTGIVADDRRVVPCMDLLLPLVIDGLPGLTGLLVAKHLSPMDQLGPRRRIRDGELLLRWLEGGQPLNRVARSLGIPPQTAHDRLNHLRHILDADLEDPDQRLELMLALRRALPRWRAEI